MIIGIGTDILELSRIEKAASKKSFLNKIFTENELGLFYGLSGGAVLNKRAHESIGANFAVKEAIAKALGTGFRGFPPSDIEVLRDELGKPYVNLFGKAHLLAKELNVDKIHVTISHCSNFCVAYTILEGNCLENSFCKSN